ncbi:UbiA prenyltransferase family domain-containing protein [Trichoderma chlorosporum]
MLAWIWLNLLVEDIANQRLEGSIVEDAVNKPWRPLPSRRLTPEQARDWLVIAIVAAVGFSALLGCYTASVTLMLLIWMYNDLDGSNRGIWVRNALNAGGLMCFSWGALATLSGGKLLPEGFIWILVTGAIIMTTVHAQDLPDIEGDMARGRQTVPLLYGETVARASLALMVMFWSLVCPLFWGTSPWGWAASTSIGATMSVLALQKQGQWWDEVVWKLWCLWIVALYLLPALKT